MVRMTQRRGSSVLGGTWDKQANLGAMRSVLSQGQPGALGAEGSHLPGVGDGLRKSLQEKVMSICTPGGGVEINMLF